jgi:DNA-binding response OmpR family regulator
LKVLLVDDEDALRMSLADDIREAGHEVFDFSSPKTALEFFRQSPDTAAMTQRPS